MRAEKAINCFSNGFNCAQAVLTAFSDDFLCPKKVALQISGAFGSGMGQLGETCGAVTGALMVLGLKYGKYKQDDTTSKDRTYANVKRFNDAFIYSFGSIKCSELIEYNLSKPEELTKAREAGVFQCICPKLIERAVNILESLVKD